MAVTNKQLHFSEAFAISCGTVTLDIERAQVLLIFLRKTGEYLLPKGRKDIGEPLEHTALRETYEETGIPVKLLPTRLVSLATKPKTAAAGSETSKGNTEPFAVSQRVTNGKLKIIFWYVAEGDSTKVPDNGTQDEGEDFETVWVGYEQVVSRLSFEDDCQIAGRAIQLGKGMALSK